MDSTHTRVAGCTVTRQLQETKTDVLDIGLDGCILKQILRGTAWGVDSKKLILKI